MEITIISVQGLKNSSSLFSHHIRPPFITLTITPPSFTSHTTTVDHHVSTVNPTLGDNKFDLSNVIDASFFYSNNSYIYLHLYTNRLFLGPKFIGWCGIPTTDIADGFSPVGATRQLSYRLRKKDGSRGHGVVNVGVRLESSIFQASVSRESPRLPEMNFGRVAIGIPVKTHRPVGDLSRGFNCP